MTAKSCHVLIIGAGLGGLALAQGLRKQGISFEVFERDAALESRFQGWAISLHRILEDFQNHLSEDLPPVESTNHLLPLQLSGQFRMLTSDGTEIGSTGEGTSGLLRANRRRLRRWLATNINVSWGKRLTSVEQSADSVTAHFEDSTSATGDVLVGADGVRSLAREFLFPGQKQLRSLPLGTVIGQVRLNKEQYHRQMEIARSSYVVWVDGTQNCIFVGLDSVDEDESHANYYWYFNWLDRNAGLEDFWTKSASQKELFQFVKEQIESVKPELAEVISLTKPEELLMPVLSIQDLDLEHIPKGRVTLLGDAAHAMSPYRGEGGDHAMRDGIMLAQSLGRHRERGIDHCLRAYVEEMLPRGRHAVQLSRDAVTNGGSGTQSAMEVWKGAAKE